MKVKLVITIETKSVEQRSVSCIQLYTGTIVCVDKKYFLAVVIEVKNVVPISRDLYSILVSLIYVFQQVVKVLH